MALEILITLSRGPSHGYAVKLDVEKRLGELKRDGTPIALAYQPATLLLALLRRAPELADRQWLRSEIWSDRTIVEFDQGLNACVRQLRAALNESAAHPRYIETLPKRGYRFGVEVGRQSVTSLLPKLGVGLIGLAVVVVAIWSLGSLREAKTSSAAPSLQVLPVVETTAKGEVAVPWLQYGLRLAVVDRLSTLQPDQLVTVAGQSLWVDQASRRLPSESDYRLQMAVGDGAQHRSLTARLSRSNAAGAAHTLTTTLQSNDSAGLRSAADQVAQWVVDSLGIGGLAPVPEQTDLDPELVSLLLRARQQRQLNRPDNLRLALAHYLEVLEHAPDAHEARAGKAFVQSVLAGQSGFPVNQTYQAAWAETEKLHANAYVSVDTLLVRGFILLYHQWDIAAALRQLDAAVERAPGHAVARAWRASALAGDSADRTRRADAGRRNDGPSPEEGMAAPKSPRQNPRCSGVRDLEYRDCAGRTVV